jgi:hypothetical protein
MNCEFCKLPLTKQSISGGFSACRYCRAKIRKRRAHKLKPPKEQRRVGQEVGEALAPFVLAARFCC